MTSVPPRPRLLLAALIVLAPAAALPGWRVAAQDAAPVASADEARAALARARVEQSAAARRAARLEAEASRVTAAVDRTAREAAAVAARIQQAEAEIAAARARFTLIDRQREALRLRLATQQEPVVRLTAALQLIARRPVALSVLRPGSLRDTIYLRAVLETMLPEIRRRTASLRAEIAAGRALQRRAGLAAVALRESQAALAKRRQELATIESRQRLAQRAAQGVAARESDRALALAEDALDLDSLVNRLSADGELRRKLAELPGPVLRPARPEEARVAQAEHAPPAERGLDYILPVAGRLVSGFGARGRDGLLAQGITLAPRDGAQVVAPAAGRVAFAGPYRGYGRIVILEHDGGWTTLVANLARVTREVGEDVVQGAPLGSAGAARPLITLELRRDGEPVNPLPLLSG